MKYQRLQNLRIDNDVRRCKICEVLHVRERTYSYYESGGRRLTAETLVKIAVFYNTSIDYILELTDETRPYPRRRPKPKKLF